MEQDLIFFFGEEQGLKVHLSIFVLLLLGGLGFPIPEDLPIIFGGIAASKNQVFFEAMLVTCYVGVLIGDQTMFFFGHFFGHKLVLAGKKSSIFPWITPEKVKRVRDGLRQRRLSYIFISRHLFPIRSVMFITAGALRIPFLEFFIADAIAALVSVTIMLCFGYFIGSQLTEQRIEHIIHSLHTYILLGVIIFLMSYILHNKFRKKNGSSSQHSGIVGEHNVNTTLSRGEEPSKRLGQDEF